MLKQLLIDLLRFFISAVSASVVSKRKRFDFLLGKFTLPMLPFTATRISNLAQYFK